MLASNEATVLDLRGDDERADGYIAGSVPVDRDGEPDEIEGRVIVVCADGEASAKHATELRERDVDAVSIEGGMESWEKAGNRLQPATDAGATSEPQKLPGAGV